LKNFLKDEEPCFWGTKPGRHYVWIVSGSLANPDGQDVIIDQATDGVYHQGPEGGRELKGYGKIGAVESQIKKDK